ncbi:hypothetical protein PM082_012161 [Marasmius tenuissimus]|nr:hypothetical protein PM082_012161 [Marasmius tenuissimus]
MSQSSESSLDSALETETLVVLLFGLKLVRVHSLKWIRVSELLAKIYDSEEYDLPPEVHNLMKTYKPRRLRYSKPLVAYAIHDLTNTPTDLHAMRTMELDADLGYSTGLIEHSVEAFTDRASTQEPQVSFSRGRSLPEAARGGRLSERPISFGRAQDGKELWCKLTNKREVEVFRKLKDHDPASHHIATLFLEPYLLPNGDWLITMPDLGEDLDEIVSNAPQYLAGPVMLRIARDLISWRTLPKTANSLWQTWGEVRKWFEWEEARKEGGGSADQPPPERYSTRKADAWAIGNAIAILLRRMLKSDEPPHVDHRHDLKKFAKWMMAKRPLMKVALEALDRIGVPSPVDSAVEDVS